MRTRAIAAGVAVTLLPLAMSDGARADATSSSGAADQPSPANGHAQVIAQGLVNFGEGSYAWTLGEISVETTEHLWATETATFLLAGDGAVHVHGTEGTWVRLAAGEATFRHAGSTAAVQGGESATLGAIAVGPAAAGQTDIFTPGAGAHDVDLLRDVLAPGEALLLPAGLPVFVVLTSGAVDDDETTLESGSATLVAGGRSLTNSAAEDPATVVVAVIGPAITSGTTPPTSTSTSAGGDDGPIGPEPGGDDGATDRDNDDRHRTGVTRLRRRRPDRRRGGGSRHEPQRPGQ